jgi:hypothetical protein
MTSDPLLTNVTEAAASPTKARRKIIGHKSQVKYLLHKIIFVTSKKASVDKGAHKKGCMPKLGSALIPQLLGLGKGGI